MADKDRVYIDRKLNSEIIKGKIDAKNVLGLGLGKNKVEDEEKAARIDVFLLAMALGVDSKEKKDSQASEGLIQERPILNRPGAMSLIYSVLAADLIEQSNIREIDNKNLAYETVEQYANAGLLRLSELLDLGNNSLKDEDYIYKMLSVLDDKYEEIFE